ncbi:MAG TPA: hypothetical protein VLC48_10815, partial [Gemmatimonadota bacterium]|nr:hypothetical protein [Gemmatimonadota bacterium]
AGDLIADPAYEVTILVKPNSTPQNVTGVPVISTQASGVIMVAIKGEFDWDQVDPPQFEIAEDVYVDFQQQIFFAGAATVHDLTFDCPSQEECILLDHIQDVDGDGVPDLVLHYRVQDTDLQRGDTEACLQGTTDSEETFGGCADVKVVGPAATDLRGRRGR